MYCVRWRSVHCYPLLASNGCALWRKVKTDEGWGGPRGWSVTVLNEKDRKVLSERRTDVCQGTMQLFAGRACQALLHLILSIILTVGFLVPQTVKNLPAIQEIWVWPLGQENPLEKGISTPVFLSGEFHDHRRLAGYSPWAANRHDWMTNTFTLSR